MNNVIGPSFKVVVAEKSICESPEQCMKPTEKQHKTCNTNSKMLSKLHLRRFEERIKKAKAIKIKPILFLVAFFQIRPLSSGPRPPCEYRT